MQRVPEVIPSLALLSPSPSLRRWTLTDSAGFHLNIYASPPVNYLIRPPEQRDIVTAAFGDVNGAMLGVPLQTLWAALEITRGQTAFPTEALAQMLTLLEYMAAEAEWEALIDTAQRYRRLPHVRTALHFMRLHLSPAAVPGPIRDSLLSRTESLAGRWHFAHWHRLPSDKPFLYRAQRRMQRRLRRAMNTGN